MLATFTCRTSDYDAATSTGHLRTLNNKNCMTEQTVGVYGLHPKDKCSELVESTFSCQLNDGGPTSGTVNGVTKATCASQHGYYKTCEGTLMEPITLSSCDGFTNVCISAPISVRMSQALAYSTSLMGLLALIYNFQCKRENQKKDGAPQPDGESL